MVEPAALQEVAVERELARVFGGVRGRDTGGVSLQEQPEFFLELAHGGLR